MLVGDGVAMVSPGWGRVGQTLHGAGTQISTPWLAVSSSHSLFKGSLSTLFYFLYPLISAYLLPFFCLQSDWSPFLWLCPCLIRFPLLSHFHVPSFPLGTVSRDVSAKPVCLHHSFAPFWKENLPGFFCI